jgi:hypothetical protein
MNRIKTDSQQFMFKIPSFYIKKPTKTPEKSILDNVQIARAKDVIELLPKKLHSLLFKTTLDLLSKMRKSPPNKQEI